jgi:hypothetical protein
MPEEPVDLTQELLRQIRADQAAIRSEMSAFRTAIERRFDALESGTLELKRSLRGLTYMVSIVTGRLEDVETRVDRLTSPSS